jgi:DeoR/GlpR family transcriptional regulator of sugar metabolism
MAKFRSGLTLMNLVSPIWRGWSTTLKSGERRNAIIDKLQNQGSIDNASLAAEFDVSLDTIRRDLRILAAEGFVNRTHGGASWSDVRELIFKVNADAHLSAKRAIAHKALDYVRPGETIGVDMGSTNVQLARALVSTKRCRPLNVFTTDLRIGMIMAKANGVVVHLIGGIIGRRNYISGPIATGFLEAMTFDTVFLAASGVAYVEGITEPIESVAEIKRAMVSKAKRIILLADYSKLGKVYEHHVIPLERVHAVITNRKCPVEHISELKKRGIVYSLA